MTAAKTWVARALAALGVVLIAATTTCRVTLLRPHFAGESIAKVDGFERLYREVLPSPSVQAALRRSLAALPVDPTYVTANLRLAVPPDVLEEVMARLQAQYVAVLTDQRKTVSGVDALQPVVDHVARVLTGLLPGIIAATPRLSAQSVAAFASAFRRGVSELRQGRAPLALPSVGFDPAAAHQLAGLLVSGADASDRPAVRAEVESLLRDGDLTGALATVLPFYLDDQLTEALVAAITETSEVVSAATPVESSLSRARLPLSLDALTALGAVLVLGGLTAAGRSLLEVGSTVAGGLVLALLAGAAVRARAPDPLREAAASSSLPSVQRSLLSDIDAQVRTDITHAYLAVLAAIALVTVFGLLLVRALRVRPSSRRRRLSAGVSTAGLGACLAAVLLLPAPALRTCNGSEALCSRTYDRVTYLTSHNAMASSTRGFVNANQDPDLEGQLDNGVRALMLDLHTWTTTPELEAFAASLDARTREAWAPVLRPLALRPGVWLCHVVCQSGADPAVDQLSGVGRWMRQHPDAVVTLLLEDHVSEQQVRDTVARAGLGPLLATPPSHGAPWPTLGAMVKSGRRLVVLTEHASPSEGWLRNLYALAAETPYDAPTAGDLSCARGRGPESAPLFLLNNWVSTPAPSRSAARQVNDAAVLGRRVATCRAARGMRPTFVAVDFAQTGMALRVVDALNR